jgi:hypothetical protein
VRGVLVDRLGVVLRELAVAGDRHRPVDALGLELLGVPGVQVVPVDADGRLALLDGGRGRLDGRVVAVALQLLEEVEAGLDVVEGAAARERGRPDAAEGRTGLGRVAVESDLALVLGLEEIGEGGRTGLDALGVAADGDVAAVVVVPACLCVLLLAGDVGEGRHLVRGEQPLLGRADGEGAAEVEHVGGPVLPLAGGDGVDLVLAGAVGVLDGDLDAVLLLEAVDEGAVVGPVAGQRDGVERALLLGRLHQGVESAEVGGGGGGGGVLAVGGGRGVLGGGATGAQGEGGEDAEGGGSRQGHGHGFSRGRARVQESNGEKKAEQRRSERTCVR